MKIAFSGCRDISVDPEDALATAALYANPEILVGDCPTGVDDSVRKWAAYRGFKTTVFEADWDRLGRAAGPERNRRLVKDADFLIAFWDGKSKGTLSAISEAIKAGKIVTIHPVGRATQ